MLIDLGDGWILNTDYVLYSRPHPDNKLSVLIRLAHSSYELTFSAESWALAMSEAVEVSVTEIRAAAAAFAEAHKPDGEIVMHDMGKRKNEAKK